MDNISRFKQFLRDNDAAAKFYNNCRILRPFISKGSVDKHLIISEKFSDFGQIISSAFPWKSTAEGFIFWRNLDHKWRELLD